MTTCHAYTMDQRLLDGSPRTFARPGAAGLSIVPTTTGAAKTSGRGHPRPEGRDGRRSLRVPTPNVSCVDFVAELGRSVSAGEVNDAFKAAAAGRMKGIISTARKSSSPSTS
ncbi:MAG: hypothetical protein IPI61_02640 [Syntrophaceae bacterium]|nr:hypothetical protein [Syntrophaceae bacterium]